MLATTGVSRNFINTPIWPHTEALHTEADFTGMHGLIRFLSIFPSTHNPVAFEVVRKHSGTHPYFRDIGYSIDAGFEELVNLLLSSTSFYQKADTRMMQP